MNSSKNISITNSTTPERPCGLTSFLLPSFGMSCRGRAEAFARRLQSRLRTLGTQSVDDITNEENSIVQEQQSENEQQSWVSSSFDSQVTYVQPSLRQHLNHEADSFFDFDCEPESPGSPADECEYSRLIETTSVTPINDFVSESGYICSSPLNAHSETNDNSHSSSDEPYFDPETSEVDQKSFSTDYFDCDESTKTDDSISSMAIVNGHCDQVNDDNSESTSESLPPSQESTSTNTATTTTATPSDSVFTADNSSSSDSTLQDIILNELQSVKSNLITQNINSNEKFDTINNLNIESSSDQTQHLNRLTHDKDNVDENSIIFTQNTELILENKSQKEIYLGWDKVSKHENQHLSTTSSNTDDEDDCRPQRIRRSSSLKTGKTPPGTPGRKKIVRFADVLGLDLADIKTFLDEVPTIPKSAYEDLEIHDTEQPIQLGPKVDKILMPLFQQPGGLATFLDIVRDKQVSLENAIVSDPLNLTITGCVRVRNLDFHKSVYIRYSLDNWKSFADLQANYIENSCDGFSDKFSFILFGNSLVIGQKIEFAIRFHCKGQQFWDNNYGSNYCFQCLPSNNNMNLITQNTTWTSISTQQTVDYWCSSFY